MGVRIKEHETTTWLCSISWIYWRTFAVSAFTHRVMDPRKKTCVQPCAYWRLEYRNKLKGWVLSIFSTLSVRPLSWSAGIAIIAIYLSSCTCPTKPSIQPFINTQYIYPLFIARNNGKKKTKPEAAFHVFRKSLKTISRSPAVFQPTVSFQPTGFPTCWFHQGAFLHLPNSRLYSRPPNFGKGQRWFRNWQLRRRKHRLWRHIQMIRRNKRLKTPILNSKMIEKTPGFFKCSFVVVVCWLLSLSICSLKSQRSQKNQHI